MDQSKNHIANPKTWSEPSFPNPMFINHYTWGGTYPPLIPAFTTWSETSWYFGEMPYFWGEAVEIVTELVRHVKTAEQFAQWQQKEPEKKRKAIRLYCRIMGEKYDETKYPKDYTLTANHVKIMQEAVLGLEVSVVV